MPVQQTMPQAKPQPLHSPPPTWPVSPQPGVCSPLKWLNSNSWEKAGAAAYTRSVRISGTGRGGKPREETLEIRSLNNARAARARKGREASFGFKPHTIVRVE